MKTETKQTLDPQTQEKILIIGALAMTAIIIFFFFLFISHWV
jgi:hypothetical protein